MVIVCTIYFNVKTHFSLILLLAGSRSQKVRVIKDNLYDYPTYIGCYNKQNCPRPHQALRYVGAEKSQTFVTSVPAEDIGQLHSSAALPSRIYNSLPIGQETAWLAVAVCTWWRTEWFLQIYSDNLIPELPNTAHSCSRHGPAATWLTSARPGSVIPVPKTSTLLEVRVRCLSSSQRSIALPIMPLSLLWITLLEIFDTPLRCIA
jgi:hypothetical protein